MTLDELQQLIDRMYSRKDEARSRGHVYVAHGGNR